MLNKNISVLLVEDSLADAAYVQEMLPSSEYRVTHKTSLANAQDCSQRDFDVILLDLSLPDGHGLQSFLSMLGWTHLLPIVVLTGLEDEDVSIRAVQLGAQDYINKNEISARSLARIIRYAIERRQSEENVKRLAVLEQREEFMATLTHDLKNPLIGANRILELMASQVMGVVSPSQSELLLQIRDANKNLISMIQQLIEVYKFETDVNAVNLEKTNLLLITNVCISDIATVAEHRSIALSSELPATMRDLLADGNSMRRVVQNLLDNAMKFTPDGGKISLALRAVNNSVELEVGDNGPGISAEEQKLLFQRFSRGRLGSKYTPGSGLGLYLCKQIVGAHQGEISCTSSEGIGSTFVVKIPAIWQSELVQSEFDQVIVNQKS